MRGRGRGGRERAAVESTTRRVAVAAAPDAAAAGLQDDAWKNTHADATRRRAVLEVLSGGRIAAYGGPQQFGFIPFMPEDNHTVSPATLMMTHDLETVLRCKSEYASQLLLAFFFLFFACLFV